jgi:outer membrane scaffolding protein for murein synthesis (MipA/OmpV family)
VNARRPLCRGLAALGLLVAPAAASEPAEPLWELGVGVGALSLPAYPGSEARQSWVLPFPWIVYRGEFLRVDREGARGLLFETPRLVVDLSGDATAPVDSDATRARRGMDDLDAVVELGPSLEWHVVDEPALGVDLHLPLRAAIATDGDRARHVGWTLHPGVRVDAPAALDGWNLGVRAGFRFGSRVYHGYYYDVAASDARTGRAAYDTPAGYGGATLQLTASRRFGDLWLGAFLRGAALHGSAFEDSPLLEQSTAWSAGLGVAWVLRDAGRPARRASFRGPSFSSAKPPRHDRRTGVP